MNYQNTKTIQKRISKTKPSIDWYNWRQIGFLSHQKDWKKFELNNKPIPLDISYVPHNTEELRHTCVSKYITNRENQVILLMITDEMAYLAVRTLSALFRGIRSNNNGSFIL